MRSTATCAWAGSRRSRRCLTPARRAAANTGPSASRWATRTTRARKTPNARRSTRSSSRRCRTPGQTSWSSTWRAASSGRRYAPSASSTPRRSRCTRASSRRCRRRARTWKRARMIRWRRAGAWWPSRTLSFCCASQARSITSRIQSAPSTSRRPTEWSRSSSGSRTCLSSSARPSP